MSELSLDEFSKVYGGGETPQGEKPAAFNWKVSPALQAERDAEATRLKEAEKAGGAGLIKTSAVVKGSKAGGASIEAEISLDEFASTYGVSAKREKQEASRPFKPAGETPQGYLENIKNPFELWTKESLPAHLMQAYKRGALGEVFERMRAAEQGPPRKGSFGENEGGAVTGQRRLGTRMVTPPAKGKSGLGEILEEAKKDPGRFLAELQNAIVADPYVLAAPIGFGGRLAAGKLGRVVEAGIIGGGVNAAIEGGSQAATGKYSLEELEKATALGGLLSAPFGLLMKGKPPAGQTPPQGGPIPRLQDRTADRRTGEWMPPEDPTGMALVPRRSEAPGRVERDITPEAEAEVGPAALPGRVPRGAEPLTKESYARQAQDFDRSITQTQQELRALRTQAEDIAFKERLGEDVGQAKQDLSFKHSQAQAALGKLQAAKETLSRMPTWAKALGVGVAAYGAAEGLGQDGVDALALSAAAAGVKLKGGMWHPKAVEVLQKPLLQNLDRSATQGLSAEQQAAYIDQFRQIAQREDPLARRDAELRLKEIEAGQAAATWSQKASQSYLNKHMGTASDPLRDIEISFGEGTKSWGEVTDALVSATPAREFRKQGGRPLDEPQFPQVPPDELVWGFDRPHSINSSVAPRLQYELDSAKALKSYLSHVGDYLRQNVPPEKLSQYDLVRAVKETAKRDAEMAKAMEREAADATKDLPVHKEYPDGFKWVELKLSERLTEGQLRTIRRAGKPGDELTLTQEAREELGRNPTPEDVEDYFAGLPAGNYIAVGADGKSIQNTYTGEPATGRTPQEAYLAGQLAREGNQMGHCVGGYCEGVASGESRIFSLRDAKGKSHVTVEVAKDLRISGDKLISLGPEGKKAWDDYVSQKEGRVQGATGYERYTQHEPDLHLFIRARYPDLYKRMFENDSILQIKGKQNRAPAAPYLPYVQDFVKGGKWGEVGDLENTGLLRVDKLEDSARKFIRRLYPEDTDYTTQARYDQVYSFVRQALDEAGMNPTTVDPAARVEQLVQEFERNRGGRERGSISPELLKTMALLGVGGLAGAALFDDSPLKGALLGGLGLAAVGTVAGRAAARSSIEKAAKATDYGLGLVSTRIQNISESLHHALVDFERRALRRTYEELEEASPLMKGLTKIKGDLKASLDSAILTNDPKAVRDILSKAGLEPAWNATRSMLNRLGKELNQHGRFKSMLDDYFPRVVKDFEGLMKHLGKEESGRLDEALIAAEKESMKKRGVPLSNVERSVIINRMLLTPERLSHLPDFAKKRGLKEVTKELLPFYHSPSESLFMYVTGAVQDLEKMRLFGKNAVQTETGGKKYLDLEASIGNLVGEELRKGKLTSEQQRDLESMLRSRFSGAEQSMPGWQQDVRNLSNAMLLGNPVAAATQLGDTFAAMFHQGYVSGLVGIARALGPNTPVTAREMGMLRHIAEELGSAPRKSARVLDASLRWGGFSLIDQFGKNVNLNAALHRYQSLAKGGAKQQAELAGKYQEAFGKDYPQLVKDLAAGKKTDLVDSLLFHELFKAQPISKLETTQFLMDHPKVRIMGQLKSFMLKMLDVSRREGYNEIKKGNRLKGMKRLTELGTVLGLASVPAEAVKDFLLGNEIDPSIEGATENVLKTFGLSQYVRDKVAKGETLQSAVQMLVPPVRVFDQILSEDESAWKSVPILGRLYEAHFKGGKEKEEAKREKKREREFNRLMKESN